MMAGYLTTHVLDTALGSPAAGLKIMLYSVSGNSHRKIADMVTNADGRTDTPILPEEDFKTGTYELVFCAGEYFRSSDQVRSEPLFLDEIPIRFGMAEASHYHVPLLLSPYAFSTYRGS
jgi:5-hydroxyisourate hydrolase